MPTTTPGRLLRDARRGAELTQASLAERAHTSQPAVAAYETGTRTPTLLTLERLLSVCGRELVLDSRPAATHPLLGLLRQRRMLVLAAAREHGAQNVRIFGSVSRGDDDPESDIDFIVDLERSRTLVDLAAFREDAIAILGVAVDIATPDLLKEDIREQVLREAVPL